MKTFRVEYVSCGLLREHSFESDTLETARVEAAQSFHQVIKVEQIQPDPTRRGNTPTEIDIAGNDADGPHRVSNEEFLSFRVKVLTPDGAALLDVDLVMLFLRAKVRGVNEHVIRLGAGSTLDLDF